jgi:hypothetical protein
MMTDHAPSYEEAHDLGEVVSNGLRYRVFYDPKRQRTVCMPVPTQEHAVDPRVAIDQ